MVLIRQCFIRGSENKVRCDDGIWDMRGVYLNLGHIYALNAANNPLYTCVCSNWKSVYGTCSDYR